MVRTNTADHKTATGNINMGDTDSRRVGAEPMAEAGAEDLEAEADLALMVAEESDSMEAETNTVEEETNIEEDTRDTNLTKTPGSKSLIYRLILPVDH